MAIGFSVGEHNIVYIMMFVIAGRNKEFDRIADITIKISLFVLTIVILSAFSGIIPDYVSYRASNGRARHYLGFRYVLQGPAIYLNTVMLIVFREKTHAKIWHYVILLAVAYFLFMPTNARLSFSLTCVVLLAGLILKLGPNIFARLKYLSIICCFSYIWMAALSIYCTVYFNRSDTFLAKINKVIGNRLSYGQEVVRKYGFGLLGQRIELQGWGLDVNGTSTVTTGNYLYADNLYVQLLVNYGIIFLVIYVAIFTSALIGCYKQKNWWLFLMLLIVSIHNVIDDNSIILIYCTFWFAISSVILSRRKSKRKKRARNLILQQSAG